MNNPASVKLIGVGGIGQWLAQLIAAELNSWGNDSILTLVDGDKYDERNQLRQPLFYRYGMPKAMRATAKLSEIFPHVSISGVYDYLTRDLAYKIIAEDDIVAVCGDNHQTRHITSIRCQDLLNGTVISGGNTENTGHVLTYLRRDGVDITPPIHRQNSAIAFTDLKVPAVHAGCAAIPAEDRQILGTNEAVAHTMYHVFRKIRSGGFDPARSEIWLDLASGLETGIE